MEITMIGAADVGKALGTGFKWAGRGVTFVTREEGKVVVDAAGWATGRFAELMPAHGLSRRSTAFSQSTWPSRWSMADRVGR